MRVYWYKDTTLFDSMHPLDPEANGSGELTSGDSLFIGSIDEFTIYRFDGFVADRGDHDPPFLHISTLNFDGLGYPAYRMSILTYTTMGYQLQAQSDSDNGTKVQVLYPELCSFLNHLMTEKKTGVCYYENTQTTLSDNWTYDFDTAKSSEWTLVAGTSPSFETDQVVCPYSSVVGSEWGDYTTIFYTRYSGDTNDQDYAFSGVLNNPKNMVTVSRVYSSPDYIFHINTQLFNADYTTLTLQNSYTISRPPWSLLYAEFFNMEPEDKEYFVFADPYYDTSKPQTGYLEIIKVNSDLTLSLETIIDPIPARYSYVGRGGCALCYANDSVDGLDLSVVYFDWAEEELVIRNKADSWAVKATFAFARNDQCYRISAHRDIIVMYWYDDSASTSKVSTFIYNGTAWVADHAGYILALGSWWWNPIAGPGQTLTYLLGATVFLRDSSMTLLDSEAVAGATGLCPVLGENNEHWIVAWDTSPTYAKIMQNDGSLLGTPKIANATWNDNAAYDATDELFVSAYNNAARVITKETVSSYDVGYHTIKPNHANARKSIPASEIVNFLYPAYSETAIGISIYFAVSFDQGLTWKYWTGSAWATSDITSSNTTSNFRHIGFMYNDFNNGDIEFEPGEIDSIEVAWRFDVITAGIDPATSDAYIDYFYANYADPTVIKNDYRMLANGAFDPKCEAEVFAPDYRVYLNIAWDEQDDQDLLTFAYFDDLI